VEAEAAGHAAVRRHFAVADHQEARPRIGGELGERLVTKNYVALSELIKNAYDADATEVTICFVGSNAGGKPGNKAEIQIIDNGHGMSFQDLQDFWMRVATANKQKTTKSPRFGRPKTGSKGIGRFATQRLAEELVVNTTARVDGKRVESTEVTALTNTDSSHLSDRP
jgi:HSP90 family molecular chaperone